MSHLEDFYEDILLKSMSGQGIGPSVISKSLGVERSSVFSVLKGEYNENIVEAMASELKLDKKKILLSAEKSWSPAPVKLSYLKQFRSSYGEMIVNSFLIWDEVTKHSWVFDTGTEAASVLNFISEKNLKLDAIFLTHTHRDHIACLDELRAKTGNPSVFVHELELIDECEAIDEGFEYYIGPLSLKVRHTHGHSKGGVTYLIGGLEMPVAVVGDAIFAGSMGGGIVSYEDALRTNREKIMTLPNKTVLCPGHGPMTTIAEEKKFNPFFPEF